MGITINDGIDMLVQGKALSTEDTQTVFKEIMTGQAQDSQIASFLTALRIRGESPSVIQGAATIMRELAARITPQTDSCLVDTCGTGGDNAGTFNISTLAALVAAGAGAVIAKHGNRSITSKCGSADLLEAFGVKVDLDPKDVEKVINETGIGFMFAPKFHPAMKYAMPVRKSLKMRTIFNILGPLTNPADAKAHVLGVFDAALVEPIAKVMVGLGSDHVYVVHSEPGIDEITPISKVLIAEVNHANYELKTLTAADFGLPPFTLQDIKGGDIQTNVRIAADILTGKETGIKRDVVVLNAAYALMAAGQATTLKSAKQKAFKSITSGNALAKLKQLVTASNGDLTKFMTYFS